jgi:formylglycine-generating enzyme required for sulfatase activity
MIHYRNRMKIVEVIFILSAMLVTVDASAQEKFKPGQTFKDCPDCPEMVVIPGGKFTMGSPENETGRL